MFTLSFVTGYIAWWGYYLAINPHSVHYYMWSVHHMTLIISHSIADLHPCAQTHLNLYMQIYKCKYIYNHCHLNANAPFPIYPIFTSSRLLALLFLRGAVFQRVLFLSFVWIFFNLLFFHPDSHTPQLDTGYTFWQIFFTHLNICLLF